MLDTIVELAIIHILFDEKSILSVCGSSEVVCSFVLASPKLFTHRLN